MLPYIDQNNVDAQRTLREGPGLNLSALVQLDRALPIRGFAIKYVLEGMERYTLDGQVFAVQTGRYLLANATCECRVFIDSARPVKGLCIELTSTLMDEVAHAHMDPEAFDERPKIDFFSSLDFPEAVYEADRTALGPLVRRTATELFRLPANERRVNKEFYYALAEAVFQDHRSVERRLSALKAVRASTRKDIFRRIQRAKALMESDLFKPMSVEEMAQEAAMSSYHFFRAFRSLENMTPYQYRLLLRLQASYDQLLYREGNVQEVALRTGFADGASFSKAFSKVYGHAPSALLLAPFKTM